MVPRLGARGTEIGATTLQALAPGVSSAFARGLLTREDWRLAPRAAMAALRGAGQRGAGKVRCRPVVNRARRTPTGWCWRPARRTAWRTRAPELGRPRPPIKGQILRFLDLPPGRA